MWRRCTNPKEKAYKDYGARGITVCKKWKNVEQFYKDVGDRPTIKHSIDRKNNQKGYCPSNCHWATKIEQASNRRDSNLFTYKGETKTLTEWANQAGVSVSALKARIRRKWPEDILLASPGDPSITLRRSQMLVTAEGKTLPLSKWAVLKNIGYDTLLNRYAKGWPLDTLFSEVDGSVRDGGIPCRTYTYKGITKTIRQWSNEKGIPHSTLTHRVKRGCSEEDVFKKTLR